jgi:hypothetical protein
VCSLFRIQTVGELLGANKEELQRILRSWPNLLARDQAQMKRNMAAIAVELDLAEEDVRKVRKHYEVFIVMLPCISASEARS